MHHLQHRLKKICFKRKKISNNFSEVRKVCYLITSVEFINFLSILFRVIINTKYHFL